MPEAVIVAAARTPIGRARKGSLVDARPDDLVAFAIDAALDEVPELDRAEIVDVMVGCGFPQDRQGMNGAPGSPPGAIARDRARDDGEPVLRVEPADDQDGLSCRACGRG